MAEPTSALTFLDLIIEVAHKLGTAYYGADGTEVLQAPDDPHDLDEVKRLVNNAIRMFIHDAPVNGWRWQKPILSLDVWATVTSATGNEIATDGYDAGTGLTTITVTDAVFYESMECKTIALETTGDAEIVDYVSSTSVTLKGDKSGCSGESWIITADGNYTLPATFGGQFIGPIAFSSGTNYGVSPGWTSEGSIRRGRQNTASYSGTPLEAAVQIMQTVVDSRRRWELMLYPIPNGDMILEFPYLLYFDKLVNNTDVPPIPFGHDETIKAACRAVAEKDQDETFGIEWEYYSGTCLKNSRRVDALSAPKKLYYSGSYPTTGHSRNYNYQRQTVTFNS